MQVSCYLLSQVSGEHTKVPKRRLPPSVPVRRSPPLPRSYGYSQIGYGFAHQYMVTILSLSKNTVKQALTFIEINFKNPHYYLSSI